MHASNTHTHAQRHTHTETHTHTPGLDPFADAAAAHEDVVSKKTQSLSQAPHFLHDVSVINQVRIQSVKLQERLVINFSQQLKGWF